MGVGDNTSMVLGVIYGGLLCVQGLTGCFIEVFLMRVCFIAIFEGLRTKVV